MPWKAKGWKKETREVKFPDGAKRKRAKQRDQRDAAAVQHPAHLFCGAQPERRSGGVHDDGSFGTEIPIRNVHVRPLDFRCDFRPAHRLCVRNAHCLTSKAAWSSNYGCEPPWLLPVRLAVRVINLLFVGPTVLGVLRAIQTGTFASKSCELFKPSWRAYRAQNNFLSTSNCQIGLSLLE